MLDLFNKANLLIYFFFDKVFDFLFIKIFFNSDPIFSEKSTFLESSFAASKIHLIFKKS
jgi:hypothetical protein